MLDSTFRHAIIEAASRAATLSAVLAVVALVAWMSGLASIDDASSVLIGVFAGSFVVALFKADSPASGKPQR